MSARKEGKKVSPRGVLDFFGISPRVAPAKGTAVSLNQSYVSFDDEDPAQWYGSQGKAFPEYGSDKAKKAREQQERKKKEAAAAAAAAMAASAGPYRESAPDLWVVERLKHLSLKGLLEKATDAESYHLAKNKHIEKIVLLAKDPRQGKAISTYYDLVLKECSRGSLTRSDYSIKIMKVCYVLHCIMKKGTAQSYKNVFGNFPDIFDLPQIALPKSIPASCVEARMAIAYASYLNIRVRLRQQDSIQGCSEVKQQLFAMYGLKGMGLPDLFEKALACRFYRKRDSSTIFPRDTIHWFQLHIISDLVALFDRLKNELTGRPPQEGEDVGQGGRSGASHGAETLEKRKKQLVAWAERMQAAKYLSDGEYYQLKAIERSVAREDEDAIMAVADAAPAAAVAAAVNPFKPLPDLMSF
mmetsp:Transcript_3801/g.9838  ORF Transcript_3801/g.9838 Transcript_3801/m.9838 type:complete len:413 (-) Transcript_3801:123-1361(-)